MRRIVDVIVSCALPGVALEAMTRMLTLLVAVKMAQVVRPYATLPADGAGDVQTDPADPPWLAGMRTRHQCWLERQRAALEWH